MNADIFSTKGKNFILPINQSNTTEEFQITKMADKGKSKQDSTCFACF